MDTVRSPRRSRFRLLARVVVAFLLSVTAVAAVPVTQSAAATPTFRQAKANEIGSGTVDNVAFTSANQAGDLIVVQVLWSNTGAVTVTDTRGNPYLAATARSTWSGTWSAQLFYAKNVAAGTNTVRATFATAITSFAIVQAHEYSGIDKNNPLDAATNSAGSGTAMNSGTITTANVNDLLFAGGGSLGSMNAFASPWTGRLNTSGNRTADRPVTAAGSYSATANHSGGAWVMQVAAFKAEAGTDTTPPSIPAGLTATATSPAQINLSWTASTDDVGVTGYQVERCQGSGCTNFTLVTTVPGTSFADTGRSAATTYRYRVRATDAAGNLSSDSVIATATTQSSSDTTPPSVPTGLTGTGVSISQINLSWTASTDNVGVTGYRIFRNGTQVGTSPTPSFQDTGLTVNTTYSYTVSAFDAAGNNSAQSPPVNARTQADTTAPTVPTNLAAQVVSATQINLSWTPSTDDVGVAQYKIYRNGAFLKSSTVASPRAPPTATG
jgi:chitodextrinase